MENEDKKFEIIPGDGNLDISPVYDHLNNSKPKCNDKPKNIVVPKSKDEKEKEENNDEDNED